MGYPGFERIPTAEPYSDPIDNIPPEGWPRIDMLLGLGRGGLPPLKGTDHPSPSDPLNALALALH